MNKKGVLNDRYNIILTLFAPTASHAPTASSIPSVFPSGSAVPSAYPSLSVLPSSTPSVSLFPSSEPSSIPSDTMSSFHRYILQAGDSSTEQRTRFSSLHEYFSNFEPPSIDAIKYTQQVWNATSCACIDEALSTAMPTRRKETPSPSDRITPRASDRVTPRPTKLHMETVHSNHLPRMRVQFRLVPR
eukprot:scaffold1880_cov207-Alexandrium_tamarense.AAC.4